MRKKLQKNTWLHTSTYILTNILFILGKESSTNNWTPADM